MRVRIFGGRLIDPANGIDRQGDLYLADGVIVAAGETPQDFKADREIDATAKVVAPGLIDLLARPREPGEDHTGSMTSELAAAVKGGVTTICIPPDTYPVIDSPAMVQMIRERAESAGLARLFPVGALTVELAGERLTDMGSLHQAGCTALSNSDRAIQNTLVMRRAMQYASTFELMIMLNAQYPWLVGNGCIHEGEVSTRLGLPVIPEAAEVVGVARDLALVETTGISAHFSCLSSARAIAMIAQARSRGLPVSASVTAHHLHLCDEDVGVFNTECKVMPPLRSRQDRDALREAVSNGVIECICSDHQAYGRDAKLAPFVEAASGIAGLETLLGLSMRLVHDGVLDLVTAISALSTNPARIMGLPSGNLAPGRPADVCVFDPEASWRLDDAPSRTRGSNTPFRDTDLYGRITATLVRGVPVYSG